MNITKLTLIILTLALVLPTVSALTLRTSAYDADTNLPLNPSTITVEGVTKTGNPFAIYNNIATNKILKLTHAAAGYKSDSDENYIDANIETCSGAECNLVSQSGNEIFTTHCGFDVNFQDYACQVTNNGLTAHYFYKPSESRITIQNFLTLSSSTNQPPTQTVTATPVSGPAPLQVTFNVQAADADGVISQIKIAFGDEDSQTLLPNATSVNTNVVHTYLNPDAYNATIVTFDNNGAAVSQTVVITVGTPPVVNNPPNANAGPDQVVTTLNQIQLDGSQSSDPENDALLFSWSQTSGPVVVLQNPKTAQPTFTPNVKGTYVFQLLVSDGRLGDLDSVTITVDGSQGSNTPPVANAGPDQTVNTSTVVTLAGTGTDADNDSLAFSWVQTGGTSVQLTNPASQTPTFTPTLAGTYTFQLTVSDGKTSVTDSVNIFVTNPSANKAPTANAGADQTSTVNTQVTLSGTGNDPDNDPIAFSWGQLSGPSTLVFQNPNSATATTTPTVVGTYVLQLTVSDGSLAGTDTLTVTVNAGQTANTPPTVNAGADQTVLQGAVVNLVGTATDADNDSLAFQWTRVSGPIITINNPTSLTPNFVASATGTVILQFAVSDGQATITDQVSITINAAPSGNTAPTANAGPDQTVTANTQVRLDGTQSSDPENTPLQYLWMQLSGPTVQLSDNQAARPTFTPTIAGSYVFQLRVDDMSLTATDTVTITVNPFTQAPNQGPTANAGPDRIAQLGDHLVIDGTASSDPDGKIVRYQWIGPGFNFFDEFGRLTIVNAGNRGSLLDSVGNFTITLVVTDNSGLTSTDTVNVEVRDVSLTRKEFKSPQEKLRIDTIKFNDFGQSLRRGQSLLTTVRLENEAGKDLRDVSVTVLIPQLGLRWREGPFEIEQGEEVSRGVPLLIPLHTQPGSYLVRIVASSDDVRRVETRYIRVD